MNPKPTPTDDLRPLRGIVSLEDEATVEARRPELIALLESQIAAGPALARRKRQRTLGAWVLGSGLSAAAAVALVFSLGQGPALHTPGSGPNSAAVVLAASETRAASSGTPSNSPTSRALTRGTSLGVGSELQTSARGHSELALGERVQVDLSENTSIRLLQLDAVEHRLRLALGRIDLRIDKIAAAPEKISIETPDCVVEVRGTVFRVEVLTEASGARVTEVSVTRGLVAVRNRGNVHLLSAGMKFRSEAEAAAVEPQRSQGAAEASKPAVPHARVEAGKAALATDEATREASSTLAEQNRLFEQGLAARDRGDDAEAVRIFQSLCRDYPESPLWASAAQEQQRAAARLGN